MARYKLIDWLIENYMCRYLGDSYSSDYINVNIMLQSIESLKNGEAAGVAGLTAEHATFAYPILTSSTHLIAILLAILFRLLITLCR